MAKFVLIIDDSDDVVVGVLKDLIRDNNYTCEHARSFREASDLLGKMTWHRVFLDLNLGTGLHDGFHVLDLMQRKGWLIPTQIVSNSADLRHVEAALAQYKEFVPRRPIPKRDIYIFSAYLTEFLTNSALGPTAIASTSTEVFVVHGRSDDQLKRIVAIIQRLGLSPVVLSKAAGGGKSISELLLDFASKTVFCVVIMTGDDRGGLLGSRYLPRARQNVILELGFFYGRLGRERVLCLREPRVDMPTDLGGILYEDLSHTDDAIERRIMRELQALGVGFSIP